MRISNIYGLTLSSRAPKPSISPPQADSAPQRQGMPPGHAFIPPQLQRPPDSLPPALSTERYLRRREVCEITGLPTSTLYRLMKAGLFVRPHVLGPKCVGWPETAIRQWCADRKPR